MYAIKSNLIQCSLKLFKSSYTNMNDAQEQLMALVFGIHLYINNLLELGF